MTVQDTPSVRRGFAPETRAYLVAFFLSNVAVGGFTLATGLFLYDLTGSAAVFGGIVAVEFGIGLFGQLLGGSIIDRFNVLTVAVITNWTRAGVILVGATAAVVTSQLWPIIVAYVVSSVLRPIYRSASFALVPKVCAPADLPAVNAARFGIMQFAQITGLLLIAGLDAIAPIVSVFFVLAGLIVVSGVILSLLRRHVPALLTPDRRAAERTGLTRTWSELGSVIRATPNVTLHLVFGSVGVVVISALAVFLAPANAGLHGGSLGLVILNGAECLGALLAIIVNRRLAAARLPHVVPVGFALMIGGLAGIAFAGNILIAGFCFLVTSFGGALTATALDTLLQLRTSAEVLGRLAICQETSTSVVALGLLPLAGAHGMRAGAIIFAITAATSLGLFALAWARYHGSLLTQRLVLVRQRN